MLPPPDSIQNDLTYNIPLHQHTSLQVGGPARYWLTPSSTSVLAQALAWASSEEIPVWWIGEGSNIVVSDRGLEGLVVHWLQDKIRIVREDASHCWVEAEAGCAWDHLVDWSVQRNLQGIECLSGIPGHVGASPVQNIGAYGQELADVFISSQMWDSVRQKTVKWDHAAWSFAYRHSVLKDAPPKNQAFGVLSVTLCLRKNAAPFLHYRDLQKHFRGIPLPSISLKHCREAVLHIRQQKSMLLDPNDPNARSAGSFFTNPIVAVDQLLLIQRQLGLDDTSAIPHYPVPNAPHQVKLPAAWLIEQSGLHKGYTNGRCGLSTKHALAIVNHGQASAQDIADLAQTIQRRVQQCTSIQLHPEPLWLGWE
ncbi:MAG: UDP-N-acetylmuramate dehydrogenase [Myxococcota bacterium]